MFEMRGEEKVIFILLFVKTFGYQPPSPQICDLDNKPFREGNIGESGSFKWLGILRVHIHDNKSQAMKIALTGLVLVKDKYALANAADVANIPLHVFREDSKALFITENGHPWTCKPKSYTAHPEFEYATYVTVALVELDNEETAAPLISICWPGYSFNTTTHLYALGYTDENMLLEKVLYKMQYVNRSLCDEFYHRAEPNSNKFSVPAYYQCAYAVNNKENCVWDNGMVLASNSTGQWTLIGFGVHGPGCAGPARFIDVYRYLPWIESSTNLVEVPEYM